MTCLFSCFTCSSSCNSFACVLSSTQGIMHTRLDSPAVSHTASNAAAASEHKWQTIGACESFQFCHGMQLKQFLEKTKHEGQGRGYITTWSGRRRPIKALSSSEQGCTPAASQRAAAEADRKAVNSTFQGSAADLIKLAMCSWAAWQHVHLPTGTWLHVCCGCAMQLALFGTPALNGHMHAYAELCRCMPGWL